MKKTEKKETSNPFKSLVKIAAAIGISYICYTVPQKLADKILYAQLNSKNNRKWDLDYDGRF